MLLIDLKNMLTLSFKIFVIVPQGHWLSNGVVKPLINKQSERKRWGQKGSYRTGSQKKQFLFSDFLIGQIVCVYPLDSGNGGQIN